MSDHYIVTYTEKPSGFNAPYLTVCQPDGSTSGLRVVNNFTGDEAVKMYKKLIGKDVDNSAKNISV